MVENKCCKQNTDCVVRVFEEIFKYDIKERVDINKINPDHIEAYTCKHCIMQMLYIFNVFGVIDIKNDASETTVSIKSIRAKYFMKSLLEYIKADKQLFGNWEESKGAFPELNENNLFIGPNFLYYMEQKRKDICDNANPIGNINSSRAIIKAKIGKKGMEKYLFQYDQKAHHYKIIGGEIEPCDKDEIETIKRELKEELHLSKLKYEKNYRLGEKHNIEKKYFSKKYGAYLSINLWYFKVNITEPEALVLGEDDCWLSMDEIERRKAVDGKAIIDMDNDTLKFMKDLTPSFAAKSKSAMLGRVENCFDNYKNIITALGVLVTLVGAIIAYIGLK